MLWMTLVTPFRYEETSYDKFKRLAMGWQRYAKCKDPHQDIHNGFARPSQAQALEAMGHG